MGVIVGEKEGVRVVVGESVVGISVGVTVGLVVGKSVGVCVGGVVGRMVGVLDGCAVRIVP